MPIRRGDGRLIGGLAISGPADRVREPNENLVELLRQHAERLGPLLA